MSILLLNPIIRPDEPPQYFPLGLAYIAAVLNDSGKKVDVLDINAFRYNKNHVDRVIQRSRHDVFGLTGTLTEYKQIMELVNTVRTYHPHSIIILGGPLGTSMTDHMMDKVPIDIIIRGEGERTVEELSENDFNPDSFENIRGISYRLGNRVIHNPDRDTCDIDSLPFPARHLFPYEIYFENMKQNWMFDRSFRATNILSSRGCPYKCTYCDHSLWGYKYRQRSTENIIKELEILKRDYSIEAFIISDDTFNLNRKWVLNFCDALRDKDLGLKWMCNCRVNHVDETMLRALKSAGCVTVGFGIESGSDLILDELNKSISKKQIEHAIDISRKLGFKILTYLIIGSFSETRDTVSETVSIMKKYGLRGYFNYLTPIPGSNLFDAARKKKKITETPEALLNKWDKWQDNLLVNLTDSLGDGELRELKIKAETEIGVHRHRFFRILRGIKYHLRLYGIRETIKEVFKQLCTLSFEYMMLKPAVRRLRKYKHSIPSELQGTPYQNILVVKLFGIGNAVLSIPFFKNLRANFPDSRITVLAHRRSLPLLRMIRGLDRIITVPDKMTPLKYLSLLVRVRSLKPDVIFSTFLMTLPDIAKIYPLSGSKSIVGHNLNSEDSYYTHLIPYDESRHEAELNLELLSQTGFNVVERNINLDLDSYIAEEAEKIIESLSFNSGPVIGIHCGSFSDMPQKRWPLIFYAELSDLLINNYDASVFFFGGREDGSAADEVIKMMNETPVNMVNRSSLYLTSCFIKACDLFISNDSGLMHIASSVETPVIGLFGPSNPVKNKPWCDENKCRIVQSDKFCAHCYVPTDKVSCNNPECMEQISVKQVLSTVDSLLSSLER